MDNPEIWALYVDTTEYWDPEIVKHTGRIFDVYVYDNKVNWHLCSFSPGCECHFVWNVTENEWDELPQHVRRAVDDAEAIDLHQYSVRYYSRYDTDAAKVIDRTELPGGKMGKWFVPFYAHDWAVIREEASGYDDVMNIVAQSAREGGL